MVVRRPSEGLLDLLQARARLLQLRTARVREGPTLGLRLPLRLPPTRRMCLSWRLRPGLSLRLRLVPTQNLVRSRACVLDHAVHLRLVRIEEARIDAVVVAQVARVEDDLRLRGLHGLHLRSLVLLRGRVLLLSGRVLLLLLVALHDVVQVAVPAETFRRLKVAELHMVLDPHQPPKDRVLILVVPIVVELRSTRTSSDLALALTGLALARVLVKCIALVLARPLALLRAGGFHLLHGSGRRRAIA
eukprot:scaffold16371_cov60-Phaeocystis_antarctica.AAC.3